ncbi:MAG TPA: 5-(carboxyamino)imidazole ribonucleotide synthase [Sphingomonas sp.]|jgi:5-(carboxyamino)imidazole ribonucleotide synthase|nr:5-(carboxyamino)imidazole ribonucleotide synthase [Sphingomonas sp.]
MIEPGGRIGIVGGGQLGRMLAMAAAQLGYRCHVYSPESSGPATEVSAAWTQGRYDDRAKLAAFAASVDVATYEFENVAADPLEAIADTVPLYPPLSALRTAQDRIAEKRFAAEQGARTAPWAEVNNRADLDIAIVQVGTPAILKTTRFGYDGKGQARLCSPSDADEAWAGIGEQPAILEGFVTFEREFSVILVRAADGTVAHWDAPENRHRDGILDTSTVPAHPEILANLPAARATAERIAAALDYVGVLSVEFFATADGPVFNEMAPRVHNSGHWTIEGAETSQFENHIRAICGLPLGSTALTRSGAEMTNLIGEDANRWRDVLAEPGAHLHLYGKAVRAGRKMGHVTRLR